MRTKFKLWSETIPGNLHRASATISSDKFWIDWVDVCAMSFSGNYTVVVFKVEVREYERLREERDARNSRVRAPKFFGDLND